MKRVNRPGRVAIAAAFVASVLLSGVLSGCGLLVGPPTDAKTGKPIDLPSTEVRQYQGKRLDSIADIPENSIEGPQHVPLESYRLAIKGRVAKPLNLSYNDVIDRQSYRKLVRLNCVEGWSVDILWEGVRLVDLLNEAGYDPTAKIVIFRCYDGYSTSLPLSKIVDQNLLLAYRMNGVDLPEERGFPFQLIAEDQWGYKWAKWITEIEVSNDTGFQGYWESRGYDNDATLPELRNQSTPATTP